jgi:hypothetical protein
LWHGRAAIGHNRVGVDNDFAILTLGSAKGATQGWRTESGWDSGSKPFQSKVLDLFAGDAFESLSEN